MQKIMWRRQNIFSPKTFFDFVVVFFMPQVTSVRAIGKVMTAASSVKRTETSRGKLDFKLIRKFKKNFKQEMKVSHSAKQSFFLPYDFQYCMTLGQDEV